MRTGGGNLNYVSPPPPAHLGATPLCARQTSYRSPYDHNERNNSLIENCWQETTSGLGRRKLKMDRAKFGIVLGVKMKNFRNNSNWTFASVPFIVCYSVLVSDF